MTHTIRITVEKLTDGSYVFAVTLRDRGEGVEMKFDATDLAAAHSFAETLKATINADTLQLCTISDQTDGKSNV